MVFWRRFVDEVGKVLFLRVLCGSVAFAFADLGRGVPTPEGERPLG